MKITSKTLAVLLSVIMIIGMLPTGLITVSATEDIFLYKISGDEVTITYCDTAVTGDIVVPSEYEGNPVTEIGSMAFYNCAKAESIVIPDSVKEIGNKAFGKCTLLENVTFGKGVEKLGKEVFLECSSLEKIIVASGNSAYSSDSEGVLYNKDKTELVFYPVANAETIYTVSDNVEKIPDEFFSTSKNVKTIIIGDNVKEIGNNAFMGSRSLETVKIGKGVNKIGNQAFDWCEKLTSITVTKGNAVYASDSDGVLYNEGKTEIIKYPEGKSEKAFTVASDVKLIRTHAFLDAKSIESISFPESLAEIEASAFSGCVSLETVSYEGTAEEWNKITIGSDNNAIKNAKISFSGGEDHNHEYTDVITKEPTCVTSGQKTLKCECGDTVTEPIAATGHSFKDNKCENCDAREFVLLTDGTNAKITGYNGIGGAVVIPEAIEGYKITAIGDAAFENETEITSFNLPGSIVEIGSGAFYNTGYYNTASSWDGDVLYIEEYLIQAESTLKGAYTVKSGTRLIADYAFATATELTSITLAEETKIIGASAFSNCKSLASVEVKVTEEEWKAEAKIGATGNSYFTNATFSYLPHIHTFVAEKDDPAATCLTEGKRISKCYCGETKEEVIPATGHIFENNVCTGGCGERQFEFSFTEDNKVIIKGCHTSLSGAVTIPAKISGYEVAVIADNAFAGKEKIEKLILPAGIEAIGKNAFAGSGIVVEFAGENEKYAVVGGVLYNKARTELIYCPAGKGTKEFVIPSGVIAVEEGAFKNIAVIEKITIPVTVRTIAEDAFSGCTGLKNVVYDGTKTGWTQVEIAEGNEKLLSAAFTYTDTSDMDEAKKLADSLHVAAATVEAQETVIVITANKETDIITVSRIASDGATEVVIALTDTLIAADDYNNYILTFNNWHKSGNKTETTITSGSNTFKMKFIFPVNEVEGHIFDTENPEAFEATCTKDGGLRIYCTICDHSYEEFDKTKPAKGHSFGSPVIVKKETCIETGETQKKCSDCDEIHRNIIPATGKHTYAENVIAPTCTEKGYTIFTCTVCEDSYKGDETEAAGHSFEGVVTTAPKCEEEGVKTYTCTSCKSSKTEAVSATGHSYEETVIAPTDETVGYTEYKCKNEGCEATYKDNYIDAFGKIISVKVDDIVVYKNDKHTIKPDVEAIASPKYTVGYVVADESILTIDENGLIIPKTQGKTAVTCELKDEDGKVFISSFTVEVKFTIWNWIEWFFVDLIYGGLRDFFAGI